MLRVSVPRLCVLVLWLTCAAPVDGKKKKKGNTQWRSRKKECEYNACKGLVLEDPNCVYECVSPQCFAEVYRDHPTGLLEPGEIDYGRERTFQNCARKEDVESQKKRRKAVKEAREAAAEPAPETS